MDVFKAAGEGNLEALKQHIAAGTDLNQLTPDGQKTTPLMVAAAFGRVEAAKALIGSDTGTRYETGQKLEMKLVEANPLTGKISIVSPVGSAILGHKLGDEVNVTTPRGQQVYKIVKIS